MLVKSAQSGWALLEARQPGVRQPVPEGLPDQANIDSGFASFRLAR
jgi:hypothetical protein